MTNTRTAALVAAVLTFGAAACGGAPAPEESPSAVPGMQGETEPSLGTGESDAPDQ